MQQSKVVFIPYDDMCSYSMYDSCPEDDAHSYLTYMYDNDPEDEATLLTCTSLHTTCLHTTCLHTTVTYWFIVYMYKRTRDVGVGPPICPGLGYTLDLYS